MKGDHVSESHDPTWGPGKRETTPNVGLGTTNNLVLDTLFILFVLYNRTTNP